MGCCLMETVFLSLVPSGVLASKLALCGKAEKNSLELKIHVKSLAHTVVELAELRLVSWRTV